MSTDNGGTVAGGSLTFSSTISSSSPFFKLSAELRNTCYELAFTQDNDSDESVDLQDARRPSKALLLTCKQVNVEAKGLYEDANRSYWRKTDFWTQPSSDSALVLQTSVRMCDLDAIRHLSVHVRGSRSGGSTILAIMAMTNVGSSNTKATRAGARASDCSMMEQARSATEGDSYGLKLLPLGGRPALSRQILRLVEYVRELTCPDGPHTLFGRYV